MEASARSVAATVFVLAAVLAYPAAPGAQAQLVSIVIVRHPETEPSRPAQPIIPLSSVGRQRAALLVPTLEDVKFTHMFASHTTRSREAIEGVAAKNALPVVQLPAPGSLLDGERVTDQTTRRAAIEPMAAALTQLPPGSIALAGLNSENIYAILNKLGVPVAMEGQSCAKGTLCVPCTSNSCFPRDDFDRVWHLLRDSSRKEPVALLEFRYGAGWRASDR